jgi:hypothetical protein
MISWLAPQKVQNAVDWLLLVFFVMQHVEPSGKLLKLR